MFEACLRNPKTRYPDERIYCSVTGGHSEYMKSSRFWPVYVEIISLS